MEGKKEQVWSTTENKFVEVEIEGSRALYDERGQVKLKEKIIELYPIKRAVVDIMYTFGENEMSMNDAKHFKAGAKWLLDEAQKRGVHNKHGEFLVSVEDLAELIGEG